MAKRTRGAEIVSAALAMTVVVLGCATPYQRAGFSGGYSDRAVAPGVFDVSVSGNAYTSAATLEGYARRRGQELCRQAGYADAQIVNGGVQTEVGQTPTTYTASTSYYGNTSQTTVQQNGGVAYSKHTVRCTAVCMTAEEAARNSATMRQRLLGVAPAAAEVPATPPAER